MRRNKSFFWVLSIFMIFAIAMTNCTKEGPAGPAGEDGADGVNGTDGTDGVDGNTTCLECHTLTKMNKITDVYATSTHAMGENVAYAGGRNDCAKCHSHEGYVETHLTGRDTTAANIPIPTAFSCKTCHDSHVSFDPEDGQMTPIRGREPVTLMMDNHTTTIDMGVSNLCVNCHQPRRGAPEDDGSGEYYIYYPYWGPHYGTQSTVLQGIGGAEIGVGYPTPGSDPHLEQSSCKECHMNRSGDGTGGHNFSISQTGLACVSCHPNATNNDIGGKQTEIEGLINDLAALLIEQGIMDDADHAIVGTYPLEKVHAFYNYKYVKSDGSKGVHNYDYTKTLLINSINALE